MFQESGENGDHFWALLFEMFLPEGKGVLIRAPVRLLAASTSGSVSAPALRVSRGPWGCEIESLESAASLERWLTASGLPEHRLDIQRVDVSERGLVALKNIRKGEKLLFVPPPSSSPLTRNGDALTWGMTRAELDAYLVASPIRERAIQRITDVIGTYNDLQDRIFSKHSDLFPEEIYNMETFRWSFGILFSRLVRLPSMDGKVALVPWADMLYHSPEVETFLDYDKSSEGIVFSTDCSYQPGEQVFISYGKKSSVELLVSLNKSDKCYKEKLQALKRNGLSEVAAGPHNFQPIQSKPTERYCENY
ncbi:hypothetical protein GUJ93_ZPchr0006g45920 [Zizania palustris]|uniref:SET domain-containing protein n=1 Tax=Zizania palustris TaxID=103762 RepID=A0A8J5SV74_ZIZPA|nr:hypothetical protein GUJ93_ZPchr0006g45920 [Zizania palustris]